MPVIRYLSPTGSARDIDVAAGANVMRTAIENDVAGIEAICGGSLNCATCHVYVSGDQLGLFVAPEPAELEMLDAVAADIKPNSRLSCQLNMPAGLDVLVVSVPERQT